MTTIIHANGSKWNGQPVDDIETLIYRLETEKLDMDTFDWFYEIRNNGCFFFFGNFLTYSHVFRIETDDPEDYLPLSLAIGRNIQRQKEEQRSLF